MLCWVFVFFCGCRIKKGLVDQKKDVFLWVICVFLAVRLKLRLLQQSPLSLRQCTLLWGALRGLAEGKALEMTTLSERGIGLEKGMMLGRGMGILVRWGEVFGWGGGWGGEE